MKTQIYATFGPSCKSETILKDMIQAGMTGMRLNLSHSTLRESEEYINAYRKAAEKCGVKPQILIDMQGPELRIGNLQKEVLLEEEQIVNLGEEDSMIFVPNVVIVSSEVGDELLLDDGKIKLEVINKDWNVLKKDNQNNFDEDTSVQKGYLTAKVCRGGLLKGRKSIKNVNRNIKMPVLTEHDIENIRLAKEYGVTALMQPFVLSGEDLTYVRNVLKQYGAEDIKVFAKIENRQGVSNLEFILPEADVIVIARGDLGNDMPLWELPCVQKEIERKCSEQKKSYIVVTQMLASMEEKEVPTRAEVSDIFHAVYHGAWGVMVTGETAVGRYPVEAVKYLANTAREAETFVCDKIGMFK